MTILVGSDAPGLLGALERVLGGTQRLTVLQETTAIAAQVRDANKRLDALILNDALATPATGDIATALWDIVSFVARERRPTIPTVLTLRDDTQPAIYEALRTEVQRTGGDVYLVSRGIHTADQLEAQQIVAAIIGHFAFEPQRRSYTLVAISNAGGIGATSTLTNINLQLARLGLRVLLVDYEGTENGVGMWLRIQPHMHENSTNMSGQELADQIIHHESGVDVLFVRHASGRQGGTIQPRLDGLRDTLQSLHYDVISFDGLRNWYERSDIVAVLAQPATSPLVICPPGVKERTAALQALQALGTVDRGNGCNALDKAMLVFIEGEHGQIAQIKQAKHDLLQHYPMVTNLGTLPRDPALLSLVAEKKELGSIFDVAPKRAYCHAIRHAVRQWAHAVDLPTTWLIRPDPDERLPGKRFWSSHGRTQAKASTLSERASTASEYGRERTLAWQELNQTSLSNSVGQLNEVGLQEQDSIDTTLLPVDQPEQLPVLIENFELTPEAESANHTATDTSWLDSVRQHQRARVLRAPLPEQQE